MGLGGLNDTVEVRADGTVPRGQKHLLKVPTQAELRAAIPAHCFERSALHGFVYIARDLLVVAAFAFLANTFLSVEFPGMSDPAAALKWFVGWNFYAFWQGAALTGLWVIAHEAGHGAFSKNQVLNDVVGFTLHTPLLVPYFAWQYSHKKHHLRTNHLIEGETHVPPTARGFGVTERGYKAMAAAGEALGEDAFAFLQLVGHLLLGWPLYLLRNDTGGRETWDGKRKGGQLLDHFRPSSQLFKDKVRTKIALGTVGIVSWVVFLVKMAMDHGTMAVNLWYTGPYLWVNFWLVLYTWMHHTSLDVPHYGKEDWTWVRGALCTIDRDYGIFDWFHHDIGSTHVAHHLFHEMPFFHAKEATAALKDFLGPLYNYDGTNIAVAAWRVARDCHYVEGLEGAQYYKTLPKREKKAKAAK